MKSILPRRNCSTQDLGIEYRKAYCNTNKMKYFLLTIDDVQDLHIVFLFKAKWQIVNKLLDKYFKTKSSHLQTFSV